MTEFEWQEIRTRLEDLFHVHHVVSVHALPDLLEMFLGCLIVVHWDELDQLLVGQRRVVQHGSVRSVGSRDAVVGDVDEALEVEFEGSEWIDWSFLLVWMVS